MERRNKVVGYLLAKDERRKELAKAPGITDFALQRCMLDHLENGWKLQDVRIKLSRTETAFRNAVGELLEKMQDPRAVYNENKVERQRKKVESLYNRV